ncbi:hypothetical protein Tco_0699616 [Tanacetum coccineum]
MITSTLTLFQSLIHKTKGKKKIERGDELIVNLMAFPQAENEALSSLKVMKSWLGMFRRVRIEADRLLAKKLQEQEREKFTIEERAKFLHDTIAAQRKFLAQHNDQKLIQRINHKPRNPTQKTIMMTYLKHIKRSDEDFISIGSAEDERVLWGDLMVLFNSDDKDEFWSSQQGWIILESEEVNTFGIGVDYICQEVTLQSLDPKERTCEVGHELTEKDKVAAEDG